MKIFTSLALGTNAVSRDDGITETVSTRQLLLAADSAEEAAAQACELLMGKVDLAGFPNTRVITSEIDREKLAALLAGEIDAFMLESGTEQSQKQFYEHHC